jgi:hypothetical protein
VQRVLDLDLDFFVHGTAHWRGAEMLLHPREPRNGEEMLNGPAE